MGSGMLIGAIVVASLGTANPGPVRLILPSVIEAVPGQETNIYFDNIVCVIHPSHYAFDVTCHKGVQQAERWTWTPRVDDAGDHPLTVTVRDERNDVIATAESTVRVVAQHAGAGRAASLLCVGDSLTHASIYTEHLLMLSSKPGEPELTLVGSNGPGNEPGRNRHEGYGGWTAKHFATHYTGTARGGVYAERGSPFLYAAGDDAPRLDFERYCADVHGGQAPDFVTIFLGCNDTFHALDESIEAVIDEMVVHLDALISAIRAFAPEARIGIMPPAPPAASQDAFGSNYGSGQTRRQYKRNQHRDIERMTEHYGGREREGIYVVPIYLNLDAVHNYPTVSVPWNAHSPTRTDRQADGVHPAPEGYKQIGDSLYAWIKARLAEQDT